MLRCAAVVKGALALALAVHVHHFHGASIDYVGLAAAAAASWIAVPGPGEPVLIAEAIFAARHDLQISSVIAVAWLGASAGGIAGWVIGLKAGRAIVTARGPLHRHRLKAVQRGEQVFHHQPVLAVLLTPAWVAGMHRARPPVFLSANALGAGLWATGIGLGAYLVGPSIVDAVDDLGLATGLALVVLVAGVFGEEVLRRRRHATKADA